MARRELATAEDPPHVPQEAPVTAREQDLLMRLCFNIAEDNDEPQNGPMSEQDRA